MHLLQKTIGTGCCPKFLLMINFTKQSEIIWYVFCTFYYITYKTVHHHLKKISLYANIVNQDFSFLHIDLLWIWNCGVSQSCLANLPHLTFCIVVCWSHEVSIDLDSSVNDRCNSFSIPIFREQFVGCKHCMNIVVLIACQTRFEEEIFVCLWL